MSPASLAWAALGWIVFVGALFLGSLVLPGPLREGRARPGDPPKRYRLNGLAVLVATAAVVAIAVAAGLWSPAVILRHFWALFIVANVFSLGLAALLYAVARRRRPRRLADFFWGAEADPSWLGVDLKLFSYRPSLIGLGLLNLSFAFAQWERHGVVSSAMLLFEVMTLLYVANYFHFEHGMLFTWDLIEERFGWGLVWGDYVLVPFFYSLPGWYLVDRLEPLPVAAVPGLLALYAVGFWLFRGANEQKHRFKLDPGIRIWGASAETIGGRLLVSGFWGLLRKPNYTGELLMYYAWSLTCGFTSVVPYLPALWLTVLLPHRAWRDDRRCRQKYGELWVEYCARVRYRLLPFLY